MTDAALIDDATGFADSGTTVTVAGAGLTASVAGDTLAILGVSDSDYIVGVAGRGGSYTKASADSGSHTPTSEWVGEGVSGSGDITITFAAAGKHRVNVSAWAHCPASPLDTAAGLTSADDTPTTEVVTISGPGVLLAVCGSSNTRVSGPTDGFTALTPVETGTAPNLNAGYLVQSSPAAISTGWVVDTSGGADTSIMGLLSATDVAGGSPKQVMTGGGYW